MRAECAFRETDARNTLELPYPFNENSKHLYRPFRGNYLNDRNRVIHANFFLLFFFSFLFFFLLFFSTVACSRCSRRAKLRENSIFFHFREETFNECLSTFLLLFHEFFSIPLPHGILYHRFSKFSELDSIQFIEETIARINERICALPFLFSFLPIF